MSYLISQYWSSYSTSIRLAAVELDGCWIRRSQPSVIIETASDVYKLFCKWSFRALISFYHELYSTYCAHDNSAVGNMVPIFFISLYYQLLIIFGNSYSFDERHSSVLIFNFEQISHIVLVFQMPVGRFKCYLPQILLSPFLNTLTLIFASFILWCD